MQDGTPYKQEINLYYLVLGVKDWFFYFLKKWWLITVIVLIGSTAGVFYAYYDKAKYEARMTFALQDNKSGISGALSLASEFGFNIGGSQSNFFSGDNIIEILKSRRIIERVLLLADSTAENQTMAAEFIKLNKQKNSDFTDSRLAQVSFPVGTDHDRMTYLQDSVLFNIYKAIAEKNLSIRKPDKKLSIYEITFQSSDERFSKIFTEKIVAEAIAFYIELKSKRAKETLAVLEQRVNAMKGQMNSAISNRADVQDANVNPAFAQAQVPVQRRQIDVTVYGGAYGELFKNLELARYDYLTTMPVIQVLDEPDYPLKKIKLGRLKTGVIFGIISGVLVCCILAVRRLLNQASVRENKRLQNKASVQLIL